MPVRFAVDLTPEQEARRSALVERLFKLGGVPTGRAELLLEALAALAQVREEEIGVVEEVVEDTEVVGVEEVADVTDEADLAHRSVKKAPRGVRAWRPPVQIHVHEDMATGRMTIQTAAGERGLGRAEAERMCCDAAVCSHGGRNTTTIPPRVCREVLARDRFRCRAPGCGRTRFLEVHHIVPRRRGGSNRSQNLVTLCGACHRLWHERGGGAAVEVPAKRPTARTT